MDDILGDILGDDDDDNLLGGEEEEEVVDEGEASDEGEVIDTNAGKAGGGVAGNVADGAKAPVEARGERSSDGPARTRPEKRPGPGAREEERPSKLRREGAPPQPDSNARPPPPSRAAAPARPLPGW